MSVLPEIAATVIIPTSIDRGPLLRLSVASVLRQTMRDLEVFIVGDGGHEITRTVARELERQDPRVRFFDHPKGERRGELYRDQALQQARGRIVCYLCDRDLYFPDHVAEMSALLQEADFAHALPVRVKEDGIEFDPIYHLSDAAERLLAVRKRHGISLSFFAHTRASYQRLAEGWTTTPSGHFTDIYFSRKFVSDPGLRGVNSYRPTVLSFHRGSHPGWSTERRCAELQRWENRLQEVDGSNSIRDQIAQAAHRRLEGQDRLLRRTIVIGGAPLSLRTPLNLLNAFLDGAVMAGAKRPDLPFYHSLRRLWRRLRYGESTRHAQPIDASSSSSGGNAAARGAKMGSVQGHRIWSAGSDQ